MLLASGRTRVAVGSGAPSRAIGTSAAGARRIARLVPGSTYTLRALPGGRVALNRGPRRVIVFRGTVRVQPIARSGAVAWGRARPAPDRRYRGELRAVPEGGRLALVNVVDLEDYLRGVVPREIPAAWSDDAFTAVVAQAVAARSYAIATMSPTAKYDVFDDDRSQVYGGVAGEDPRTTRAVARTRARVLTYRGAVITAFFFSTSGGRTESAANIFGAGAARPYLVSVPDGYDRISPLHVWPDRPTFTGARLARLLGLPAPVTQLAVVRRGASPRVLEARATVAGGRTATVPGTALRTRLGLRDTWFSIARTPAAALDDRPPARWRSGWRPPRGWRGSRLRPAPPTPILPLSEVTPGMVGEARTVVRGTQIVTFPVSVLDVQRTTDGPGGSLILVRAEGPLMDATGGVAEGMSGSPVYVTGADGVARVIGAIAYGSGDQANVIVGVTPIEQMIDSSSGRRANALPTSATPARRAAIVRSRPAARRLEARDPGRIGLYPLARWTLAGVSRPLAATLSKALAISGIQLTSIGPRTPRPAVPLVPGSSMTALIAGGDVVLGAIGTTTYVDGTTVLGFGHPFLGAGRSRFLMGDGYVYQTIPAPIAGSSYKLGEPGTIQGMLVGDRADGLTGRLGPVEAISAVEHRDRRRPGDPEHGARRRSRRTSARRRSRAASCRTSPRCACATGSAAAR